MLTDTKARAAKYRSLTKEGKKRAGPDKLADRDGLYLHISPAGAKSWRFDYRLAGARETLTIGPYPEISLGQARRGTEPPSFICLGEARAMVARGESPAKAKQQRKVSARMARANTLQALGEQWYDSKASARSASWRGNVRRWLDQDIYPQLGSKPIRDVTADDVERLVRRIAEKRGVKSAHYARLALAGVFKSVPRQLGAGNPARDVAGVLELQKGKPRGRAMSAKEIPAFFDAVDRYPGRTPTKLAVKLLMLTFVRKRELVEAPWEEIDLKGGEWVISAQRMKMSKPHIVPLSHQAVECFEKLQPFAMGSKFVFPNLGDPKRPMSGGTLNKVFDAIGYGGRFTPHGARSTASTSLNAQGWSADAIERQLAHTERDLVRAAYNHADFMDERRRMMQAWADYLDGLAAGANVSPIKRAAA